MEHLQEAFTYFEIAVRLDPNEEVTNDFNWLIDVLNQNL
jgi:hypothetical protein